MQATRTPTPRRLEHAPRVLRAACSSLWVIAALVGCDITGDVGEYTDGGGRCDPLAAACGAGRTCSLRPDPAQDACRDSGGSATDAPCTTQDACSAQSQCAVVEPGGARLDPSEASPGRCARVCARDAPSCAPGERCVDLIAASGGVRIDFGVCAP